MSKQQSIRLDKVEVQLTPKQCAILLANEMRRFPSEKDFLAALANVPYKELPFIKPFYALARQALEHWHKRNSEHVFKEGELSRTLRIQYHALRTLINTANSEIHNQAQMIRLKGALQASKLRTAILQDVLIYEEIVEPTRPKHARLSQCAQLEAWADDSALLLNEISAYRNAVLTVQKVYFDNTPILFRDLETASEFTSQLVRDTILEFNNYVEERINLFNGKAEPDLVNGRAASRALIERENVLSIDIEGVEKRSLMFGEVIAQKWVRHAQFNGKIAILRETGKHEPFISERLQEEWSLKCR